MLARARNQNGVKETLQKDWGNSTAINERGGLNSTAKINQQRHSQMAKCCERRSVVSAGERGRQVPTRRRHNAGTMPAQCLLYYRKMVAVHHPDYCTIQLHLNSTKRNLTRHRPHHGTPKSGMAEVNVH